MSNVAGQLALVIAALVALLSAWRPRGLSRRIGEISAGGVQARPLALTVAAFLGAAAVLPQDAQFRLHAMTATVYLAQFSWIAYRSNPDSWPIVGSRSRLARIGTFVFVSAVGAAIGAGGFIVAVAARHQARLSDVARLGAVLGPGAALAIWEWRANSRLAPEQSAAAD
ncbi:MAG: hypothetical protein ACHQSE_03750 [Gemmatimonadales bacterium]